MKKIVCGLAFAALCVVAPIANADDASDVKGAYNAWATAMASKKPEAVVGLYDPRARLLATLDSKPLDTQEERLAYFSGLMKKDNLHVEIKEEKIEVLDADTAIDSGIYAFVYNTASKTVNVLARFTFVFEKKNNIWVIAHHHSSVLPN